MTTRYGSLQVILNKDIREDDLEYLIQAFKMMKNVVDVKPVEDNYHNSEATRVRFAVKRTLYKLIDNFDQAVNEELEKL